MLLIQRLLPCIGLTLLHLLPEVCMQAKEEISAFNTVSSSQDEGKLPDANVCSKFELKCIKCQKSYSLAHCKEFEQIDYAAKLQFARQKKLVL